MQRAIRRHNKERMKARAIRVYPGYRDSHGNLITKAQSYLADHLAVCSCYGCGNQRKHEGPTMQEKRFLEERV